MREQRYALTYELASGTVKTCYPKTEAKKNENIEYCKEKGIKVVSCKKLYPFSTSKNQHNFMLISNICYNTMYDMASGKIEMNKAEYERLEALKEKADNFFCMPLPVVWLPYEELQAAKEIAQMAIERRIETCLKMNRPDLLQYC